MYIYSHGNGTQKIFYNNPNVLYISIHRWESGKFYPFTGPPDECGQYEGLGYNVNIALNESKEKPSKF
jgi:acetoin utilization deacetylase AcuC-like enzyme